MTNQGNGCERLRVTGDYSGRAKVPGYCIHIISCFTFWGVLIVKWNSSSERITELTGS